MLITVHKFGIRAILRKAFGRLNPFEFRRNDSLNVMTDNERI